MLRKEGFLNLLELFRQVALDLPQLPLEADDEFVKTQAVVREKRATLDFHLLCDFLESVHLWDGKDYLVKVDAYAVFLRKKSHGHLETALGGQDQKDYDSAERYMSELDNRWQFIPHPLLGRVQIDPWPKFMNSFETDRVRRTIFRQMTIFNGYFILLSESDLEAPMSDLLFYRSQLSVAHGGKRPSTIENILDCFNKAFPHGKGSATWEEVEDRVGYSRRSILRALQGARKI